MINITVQAALLDSLTFHIILKPRRKTELGELVTVERDRAQVFDCDLWIWGRSRCVLEAVQPGFFDVGFGEDAFLLFLV